MSLTLSPLGMVTFALGSLLLGAAVVFWFFAQMAQRYVATGYTQDDGEGCFTTLMIVVLVVVACIFYGVAALL